MKARGAHSPAGVRNLQSQPGRLAPPATPVSPPRLRAQAPTQPASALLVLALSRDRGPRGELSLNYRAARPPPLLLPRPGEPPIPAESPVWPYPSSGRTAVPQPLVCLGLWEVGSQGRSRARGLTSHPALAPHAPRPFRVDRLGGGLQDKTSPTSHGNSSPPPLCLSFPREKDALNLDQGTCGRV